MLETVEREAHWRVRPREGEEGEMGIWRVRVRWPWDDCQLYGYLFRRMYIPLRSKDQGSRCCRRNYALLERKEQALNHPTSLD